MDLAGQIAAQTKPVGEGGAPYGSLMRTFGPQQQEGGGSSVFQTGGYGSLPKSAGPYAEALQNVASPGPSPQSAQDLFGFYGRQQAAQAAKGRGEYLQAGEQAAVEQQTKWQALKTQLLQKLLALFGGGSGGVGGMGGNMALPAGVSPDPKLLAAIQAKIAEEFERPGGLQSKLQQLGTASNRYTADSTTAAARQASLDRARAGAMAESYIPALEGTVRAMQPGLQQEQIVTNRLLSLLQGVA